jgi:hypothetical protein
MPKDNRHWLNDDGGGLISNNGDTMTVEQAHEAIRKTIELKGRFILSAEYEVHIGEIQTWAGLPMRVVRFATYQEAVENCVEDLWGDLHIDPECFFFEVEVAD